MSLEGLAKELLRKMADYQYEIRFLEAAAPELKRYLLSEEVYWNLGLRSPAGKRPYPQFSLGWLLVFRRRLGACNTADARKVLVEIEEIEKRWKSAWARKAAREYVLRIKLWTNFMNDLRRSRDANRDRYAYEIQRRTMLELLGEDAEDLPKEEVRLLRSMDKALRGMLAGDEFIEDESHQAQFPQDKFWFLYGSLR